MTAENDATGDGRSATPGLAATAALLVAVLGAVGVTGEALTRAVRNHPVGMTAVVALVLTTAAVPVFLALRARWTHVLALALLLLGLVSALALGATSVAEREQPRVELSSSTSDGITTVTVDASGSSLQSEADMLVQLLGLDDAPGSGQAMDDVCNGNAFADGGEPPAGAEVLLWQQAGPDADGAVALESSVEFSTGDHAAVCAYVALRADRPEDARAVQSLLLTPDVAAP
jgi:hypothetical protein